MKKHLFFCFVLLSSIVFGQTINEFPYTADFEELEGNLLEIYPEGWISEDLNTVYFGNETWQTINNSNTSQNTHSGEVALHMMSHMSQTNNDWLFTPGIEMIEGEVYTLKFYYSAKIISGTFEKIKVHIADENNAAAMLETAPLWSDENVDSDDWRLGEVSYIAENSGIYYFSFHYFSDEFMFVFLLDDVEIDGPTISSISTIDELNYQILGNPVQSEIKLNINSSSSTQITLWSIDGKNIFKQQINSGLSHLNIPVDKLPNGSYFLKIENEETFKTEHIILNR